MKLQERKVVTAAESKSRRGKVQAPYGPNIVRAWFDTVFRYLLRGLEAEQRLLSKKNWTWTFQPPSLEGFAPVRQHLPREARANLDQFLSFHSEVPPLIEKHDRGVKDLLESCRAFHVALIGSPALRALYSEIASEFASTVGGEISNQFGAYQTQEDHLAVLADNIVNNPGELPSFYATSRLWNHYRSRLSALRGQPGLKEHARRTEAVGRRLGEAVEMLLRSLRTIQSELSLTYDVPIVHEVHTRE